MLIGQVEEQVGKVHVPHQFAQRRHNDVIDKARHDFSEGAADDNADSHVDDIAPHGELFELLQHTHCVVSLL